MYFIHAFLFKSIHLLFFFFPNIIKYSKQKKIYIYIIKYQLLGQSLIWTYIWINYYAPAGRYIYLYIDAYCTCIYASIDEHTFLVGGWTDDCSNHMQLHIIAVDYIFTCNSMNHPVINVCRPLFNREYRPSMITFIVCAIYIAYKPNPTTVRARRRPKLCIASFY